MLLILHVNGFDDDIVDVKSLTSLPLEGLLNIKRNILNLEMLEGDNMESLEANTTSSGKLTTDFYNVQGDIAWMSENVSHVYHIFM